MGRKHVSTLMKRMGIEALYRKPRTTHRHPEHKVYPYLLRNLEVTRTNQVWAMDLTYIPMARGFVYMAAADWYSRRVLAWKLSTTMDVHLCLEAVEEAMANYDTPEIMNTDQGSQFTSQAFTGLLKDNGIRISMDGRQGAWRDNVFVERLWRSLKYEDVYLHAYDSVSATRAGLDRYFRFYNSRRPHSSLDQQTPVQFYFEPLPQTLAA